MEWTSTSAKVHKTFHGLQRGRDAVGKEEEEEDRITASIAAGLSNMPEENQVRNRPPHEEVPHEKMRLRFHGEDMVSTLIFVEFTTDVSAYFLMNKLGLGLLTAPSHTEDPHRKQETQPGGLLWNKTHKKTRLEGPLVRKIDSRKYVFLLTLMV